MPSNPAFEKDTQGSVQDAEAVFLDTISNDFETESLGYGDADTHGCWHKFKEHIRKIWTTREMEEGESDRELIIKTTLRELLIYILFVITLVTIAFGMLDSKAFYMTETIRDVLMNTPVKNSELTLGTVNSIDDYWNVLRGPLLDVLYDNVWYNEAQVTSNDSYFIGYESLRLGLIRIRQGRMGNHSCTIPNDFAQQITTCYGTYRTGLEETSPFGPANSTAWKFTDGSTLQMGMHLGSIAVYGGGGYYLDLPNDKKKAISRLNELFENLWIDRGTSVIFIHVNIYNPNVNLFCIVSLVAELPPTGGILISSDFRTVKLLRYVRTQDYVVLVFECLFLLFVIYYITEEVIEISNLGAKYFKKFWNILDILVILLSCVCAGFNIYRTVRVNATIISLLSNPEAYSNFERLSYWEMQFNYAVGVLVFLVWIKIFKYVSFNKTMNQLNLTLGNCAKDIAGFGVMFFIVFFAFAQLGYLAFGTQVSDFGTFATSLMTLFRIILGDFDFQALQNAQNVLGPLYFLVYIFFVFFVLINMFIAIINDTYLEVKSNLLNQPSEFQMKAFFKTANEICQPRVAGTFILLSAERSLTDDVRKKMREYTTGEVDSETLATIFRSADTDNDKKLSKDERRALRFTLENKKMDLMQEMFTYQEQEIGNSYEQFSKMLSSQVASKEDMDRAYMRVTRIENCIKTVTERLKNMIERLEQSEESKTKRTEQMQNLLSNLAVNAPPPMPPPPAFQSSSSIDKQMSIDNTDTASIAPESEDGVRKRVDRKFSIKSLTKFGKKSQD
ncbi:unnamed protein product [Hymenolepis diminuta]|uniref:PKD_channel domain-containing protein n=1 Tax=Hymenolepis diminuta TaxID=6216 RepID=A0A158QFX5_HYMDI|nr:unnamed protein product [Hymenolepis diminuta]